MPVSMKMVVFWVVVPCSSVEVYGCVRTVMMKVASSSETSVKYQTTWCNSLEDSHLYN
jgi:hypothetical protein